MCQTTFCILFSVVFCLFLSGHLINFYIGESKSRPNRRNKFHIVSSLLIQTIKFTTFYSKFSTFHSVFYCILTNPTKAVIIITLKCASIKGAHFLSIISRNVIPHSGITWRYARQVHSFRLCTEEGGVSQTYGNPTGGYRTLCTSGNPIDWSSNRAS